MNKDKMPFVTALLRASRSQDEDLLREALENILKNGISEYELNSADCSGRVSLSFISMTFPHFSDMLLFCYFF